MHLEQLEPRRLLAADPLITEFMASNGGTLRDGYGASPDWIEVFNNGDEAVDLDGYVLSDNDDFLTEGDGWVFPSVILDPGEYLVVFASGLDTVDPAGHLHTDFALSSDGDYLALADPQGSLLSEFGSNGDDYPPLAQNESYGSGFNSTFTEVVTPTSPVTYWVPTDGSADSVWTDLGFNDSTWQAGVASLGYEASAGLYTDLIDTELPNPTDSVYVRIPFSVTDPEAVIGTLQMTYDDGFVAYLNGVEIASANAPVSPAFDSEATEFRTKEAAVEESSFNVSSYSDVLQLGTDVLAIHVMDAPTSPSLDLLLSASLTIGSGDLIAPDRIDGLIAPTPGLPNTNTIAGGVQFSQAGGVFDDPFELTLTPTVPGEVIRYTIDGSVPDASSLLYSDPLTISATTRVRARAFGADGRVGRDVSTVFTAAEPLIPSFDSDLPIVVIENFANGIPGTEYGDAYLSLYDIDPASGRSSLEQEPDLVSLVGHRRRGSSTFGQPKPNLRIEFRDESGQDDKDVALLGMPENSDWILYAPYDTDRSLVRNTVMYDLAGQLGGYAIRTRYVEVYFNADDGVLDSDDYMGVYVLMETIKEGEFRVDVEPLTASETSGGEVTGGYVLKIDRSDGEEDSSWDTTRGSPGPSRIVHVEPSRSDLTQEQVDYIRGDIADFESALYGSDFADPEVGYAAYIDVDSWIDHHLLRVFSREIDAVVLSEHLYKDSDGKLAFGPIWDFDRSGGSEGSGNQGVEGWNSNVAGVFDFGWWGRLFDDPNFQQLWVDRWTELRQTTLSPENLAATVESNTDPLLESQQRDADRWPSTAPNGGAFAEDGLTGWDAEVSHYIGWLTARGEWIDDQVASPAALTIESIPNLNEGLLTLDTSAAGAAIYYTTDGSDPRASGGGIAPGALLYSGPTIIDQTSTVNARVFDAERSGNPLGGWSAMTSDRFTVDVAADASSLRISELHYNPLDPTSAELSIVPDADNNSFEFVELINVSDRSIDLNGVEFTEGIGFDFTGSSIGSLAPGQTVLVVQNQAAFEVRYGVGLPIAGEYDGRLSGGGEDLVLLDALGETIHDFEYDDDSPWPEAADGDGPSIEVIDLLGDLTLGTNWRASATVNGTPGTAVAPLLGDYDRSGEVDDLDRLVWASQYGATVAAPGVGADGNRDGRVDAADYGVWRDRIGATAPTPVAFATIPSPSPTASEETDVQEPTARAAGVVREAFAAYGVELQSSAILNARHGRLTSPSVAVIDRALLLIDSLSGEQETVDSRSLPDAIPDDFEVDREDDALKRFSTKTGRGDGIGTRAVFDPVLRLGANRSKLDTLSRRSV